MLKVDNRKEIKKWMSELMDRQQAFKQVILKKIALLVESEVKRNAPKRPQIGNYSRHLTSAIVQKGGEPATAIVYTGSTFVNAAHLDGDKTLLYLHSVKRETPRNTKIFELLKLYEPWTTKTFPAAIKITNYIMVYKHAAEAEVKKAGKKNHEEIRKLSKEISKLGVKIDVNEYQDEKKIEVLPDLTFQVLMHELGTAKEPKPHWIPALSSALKKSFLKNMMTAPEQVRILADPGYNAFRLSGKMSLKVTEQSVQSTAEFTDYLMNSKESS